MKLGSHSVRYASIAAALLLAVPLVGGILLRTETVQGRIREGLSLETGMQVKCESFHPGLWSATRMTRLTASNSGGSSLSANEAYVKLELLPLLTGRLVFREIRVEGLRLVCIEPPRPQGGESGARAGESASGPQEKNPNETNGSNGLGNAVARRLELLKTLRSLTVANASMDWQLADGRTKMQVEGVDFELRVDAEGSGSGSGSGQWTARRGTWMDMIQVRDLQASLRLADGILHAEDIKGTCGEGPIKGVGEVALKQPQPFSFQIDAGEVDLEKMSDELPNLRLTGRADAGLRMQGMLEDDASWTGAAKLGIQNGRLKGVNLLQMIGQIFQIQEIANFQINQGLADIRIADKKIVLNALKLDGGDLLLSAPGTLDFQRNLALEARLSIPERLLTGRMAVLLSQGFSETDEKGMRSIVFQIGGTLDKPSTNLMEKVVGEGLGGVVNQLLGGFLKPRKVEKTEAKEPQAEAPR